MIERNSFTMRTLRSFRELNDQGFTATNIYNDGVMRMVRVLPNGDTQYTFIGPEGDFRPPRIWEATIEDLQREWAAEDAAKAALGDELVAMLDD